MGVILINSIISRDNIQNNMLVNDRYPIKYPYAGETFQRSLKHDLDRSTEIPIVEHSEANSLKTQQLKTQKTSVTKNASFGNQSLDTQLSKFLDAVFTLGSQEALEGSPGENLSSKVDSKLGGIFEAGNTATGSSAAEEQSPLTEEQKSHGKGLVMNFLRDYILERNFLQLAPENTINDATGTSWTSASVSIAGNHTKAVNSDSYQEPKPGSRILGLVADGVSHCPNPIDDAEIARLKASSQDEFTIQGQVAPNETLMHALYKKDSNSYGSHYFSKLVGQSVNEFYLPQSMIFNENSPTLSDQNAINAAQRIVKNPMRFWNDTLYELIGNVDKDSLDTNFFEAIANYLQQNPMEDSYPKLDLVLRDKTVQQFLIAALPLSRFNLDAIGEKFTEIFDEKDKSIMAASHLSYAMDLGDKIALVRIGDSPIKAFDFEGTNIIGTNNISFKSPDPESEEKLNSRRQNLAITIDRTKNPDQAPVIDIPNNNVVIELVDKAKVDYIAIASDGIGEKADFSQRITDIFDKKSPQSSKEVINEALKLSTDRDDRTMVVLKRNS